MDIVANCFLSSESETEPESVYEYDNPLAGGINRNYVIKYESNAGYDYRLLLCLACKEVTLCKSFKDDFMDLEDMEIETLYPPQGLKSSYLPYSVQKAYEAALKARSIDANAYAILLGRMLEAVCEDRKAKGKDLYDKLVVLAEKGEIPNNLVGVAHELRKLRNVGVHEPLGGLSKDEIPILDDLSRAILEYLYIAPSLARKAVMHLKLLKDKKSKFENGEIMF
jgi:hypothetical protein